MTTATRPPPSNGPVARTRPKFGRISADGAANERIVVHAVEGFGKTTLGAYAPKPAILMSRGETGYVTLRRHNLVPECDCIELGEWQDVLTTVDDLTNSPHNHESVVLDAVGGFERLCHEFVCARDFKNDWGEKGFGSFQKGYDISVGEWLSLLARLERLRNVQNIPIILLAHSRVKPFKNPLGPDFDRYIVDCHEKTWGVTHKWADSVFFGNFVTVTEEKKRGRTKGIGGDDRVLYTTRRDAYDAKNRYGLVGEINMPNDPAAMWTTLWEQISSGAGKSDSAELPPL